MLTVSSVKRALMDQLNNTSLERIAVGIAEIKFRISYVYPRISAVLNNVLRWPLLLDLSRLVLEKCDSGYTAR